MTREIQVYTDPTPVSSRLLTENQMRAVSGEGVTIIIGAICNWGFGLGVAVGVAIVIIAA